MMTEPIFPVYHVNNVCACLLVTGIDNKPVPMDLSKGLMDSFPQPEKKDSQVPFTLHLKALLLIIS